MTRPDMVEERADRKTRRKMILLLIIMTPGIPEYLTGSSRVGDLVFNTPSFFLGLALNMGLYSCGALLIREFVVRFHKGWGSTLLLGCAYGIVEEGISVHTFVQVSGNPVGLLGIYGRFGGINWVWSTGLTVFHSVFSIGLPLLLLTIAFPMQSVKPLLRKRGIFTVGLLYFLTIIVLNLVLYRSGSRAMPTGFDYLLFSAFSLFLVVLAYKYPAGRRQLRKQKESRPRRFYFLGVIVFPLYAMFAFLPVKSDGTGRISPVLDIILFLGAMLAVAYAISLSMPSENNLKHKLMLAAGLITPLLVWAELMELIGTAPLITAAAVMALLFLLRLRNSVRRNLAVAVA